MRARDADQTTLFDEATPPRAPLPVVGEQKDIRYFAATARSVLNTPAATGMEFWSINPYVGCAFGCQYCYARYAHRYVAERLNSESHDAKADVLPTDELPPWLAFERRILVKREAPQILERALLRPAVYDALHRETVVIGTATDPYQPAERHFRVTRGVLEVLAEHRDLSITIITKSPLVTRDIDVLSRIRDRSRLSVHVSLITVDRELARRIEPRAPTPDARLRAIARLRANDIHVGVNCMPVLPGITDSPEQIEELVMRIAETKATHIGACALRLQSTARDKYLPFIADEFPELSEKYRRAYARSHQVGQRYRDGLRARFVALCGKYGLSFGWRNTGEPEDAEAVRAEDQFSLL
ncbi:MAG: radical SAM protein [Gemmatimonadota bacterium]